MLTPPVSLDNFLTLTPALLVAFLVLLAVRYARSPWRSIPPSPWGFPIIGHVHLFKEKTWMIRQDCRVNRRYLGDLMYLNAFGQPIVFIQSLKAAYEILDKRANISSDRPRYIAAHEILCGGLFTASMPYGDLWRRTRRAAHEGLAKLAVRDYHPILRKEATLLSSAILDNQGALEKHFQRFATSAILSILYDYPTLENEHDETLKQINTFIARISEAAVPEVYLLELFPWMMHIPESFVKWKREARKHFKEHTNMFNALLNAVRSDVSKGCERPSMSASLIKNSDRNGLSSQEMAWLIGTLYTAGAETTYSSLAWWALAMVARPEIQKRAQAELDAVVGRARPPAFSDASNLSYIQAIVKETLRWRPALPLGIPHSTNEDIWYDGVFIPKGTKCVANLWQCHHDPAFYGDDAAEFNPERFLDAHGRLLSGPAETRDEGHSTFGFGRRACVGKYLANDSLFITIATVLWGANLERIRDENGKEVAPDTETFVDTGVVFRPLPYWCDATPRFPEARLILAEESELFNA